MNIDQIAQIGVLFTGVIAVYLSGSLSTKKRMYGGLFGLLGEPFWFTTAYMNNQPGIMALVIIYIFVWVRLFNNNRKALKDEQKIHP